MGTWQKVTAHLDLQQPWSYSRRTLAIFLTLRISTTSTRAIARASITTNITTHPVRPWTLLPTSPSTIPAARGAPTVKLHTVPFRAILAIQLRPPPTCPLLLPLLLPLDPLLDPLLPPWAPLRLPRAVAVAMTASLSMRSFWWWWYRSSWCSSSSLHPTCAIRRRRRVTSHQCPWRSVSHRSQWRMMLFDDWIL